MPAFEFITLDVFTGRPFGGNPLAILPDARGLDTATMQSIATEFNLSETVFLLPPPEGSDAIATARIFTPVNELPFAGHPNVGTSFYIARQGGLFGKPCGDRFVLDELGGDVECRVEGSQTAIAAPKPLSIGAAVDVATIAACAGIGEDSVSVASHPPQMISVGLAFVTAELRSLDDLANARPVSSAFTDAQARHRPVDDFFSLHLYVRDPADPSQVRTRMFAPLSNIPEDPATGSAGAALAAFLAKLDGGSDERRYDIVQGVEMGRRSDITATVIGGRVWIGGPCIEMQRGTIAV